MVSWAGSIVGSWRTRPRILSPAAGPRPCILSSYFDILSSSSLICSSASVILLLISFDVFFILVIVLFITVCLFFCSYRSLLHISYIFSICVSILFLKFWIIFAVISVNSFSGSLPVSSSFI